MTKGFVFAVLVCLLVSVVFVQPLMAMAQSDIEKEDAGGMSNAEIDNRGFVGSCPSEEEPAGDIPEPEDNEGGGYADREGTYENY